MKCFFRPCLLLLVTVIATVIATTSNHTVINNQDQLKSLLHTAESHGIINQSQVQSILSLAASSDEWIREEKGEKENEDEKRVSIFMTMYNQLTLLNVLYFTGSLLIMGAYSLLMNIAWEHFSSTGISGVMLTQVLATGAIGISLWINTDNYQMLGGLLCTISTSMVPYTVYWIQKALQIWPVNDPGVFQDFRLYIRPGWVAMEIATVIVGLLYLTIVRFPFLLAPVAFCLWFLSMDVTPILPRRSFDLFELRRYVSIAFGLGLMISGRTMEYLIGSDPDFGYWLYLFGLIAFWFSITLQEPTPDPFKKSFYFLINITLVLIGSHLNRTTFHLFGTVGVALFTVSAYVPSRRRTMVIQGERSLFLWLLKSLAAIGLLAQAIRHQGSIEVINAIVCFIAFNIESIVYITLGEHYSILVLLTNIGFVAVVPSLNHTLSLWFVELNFLPQILSLFSLSIFLFHFNLLKYVRQESLKYTSILYMCYRAVVSVILAFVLLFLRQGWYAWVGGAGLIVIAIVIHIKRGQIGAINRLVQYVLLLASICLAVYFESNAYYFIACICMTVMILSMLNRDKNDMIIGCVFSSLLILLSVPLQSKFMTVIGGIYVFGYLSHLAYVVFKKSILFPLALIGLGLSLIYAGVLYQSYQEILYQWSISFLPKNLHTLTQLSFDWYPYFAGAQFSVSQFVSAPYLWVAYPGMLIHALAKESMPYSTVGCLIGMVIVVLAIFYTRLIAKYCPDLTSSIEVNSMILSLGPHNGMIVKVKGKKPSQLELPKYISLNIEGEQFWEAMKEHFNGFAITVARSAFLPYQLTPHSISCTGFTKGSTNFTATISIGTGEGGRPAIGKQTIQDNARKVHDSMAEMSCNLLYSNAIYLPYASLCKYKLTVDRTCHMLLEN